MTLASIAAPDFQMWCDHRSKDRSDLDCSRIAAAAHGRLLELSIKANQVTHV
jgi:hypothetical protein